MLSGMIGALALLQGAAGGLPVAEAVLCAQFKEAPARYRDCTLVAWTFGRIDPKDWKPLTAADGLFVMTKPGRGPAQIWARQEYREPQKDVVTYGSALRLYELDCSQGRTRVLQATFYAANNLAGEAESVTVESPQWQYATPGTILEKIQDAGCPAL